MCYLKEVRDWTLSTVWAVWGKGRLLLSLMPLESDEIVQVENTHTCYETSLLWNKLTLLKSHTENTLFFKGSLSYLCWLLKVKKLYDAGE